MLRQVREGLVTVRLAKLRNPCVYTPRRLSNPVIADKTSSNTNRDNALNRFCDRQFDVLIPGGKVHAAVELDDGRWFQRCTFTMPVQDALHELRWGAT